MSEPKVLFERWVCENPNCLAIYAEYVNGCPRCYVDEQDNNGKRVCFSVRHQRIIEAPEEVVHG